MNTCTSEKHVGSPELKVETIYLEKSLIGSSHRFGVVRRDSKRGGIDVPKGGSNYRILRLWDEFGHGFRSGECFRQHAQAHGEVQTTVFVTRQGVGSRAARVS